MVFYKHYIKLDDSKRIVDGFSSAFRLAEETDICIYEGTRRQFNLGTEEENPQLFVNDDAVYKYADGVVEKI